MVYLDILLQELSVTRAADRIGITQPALSNGLKRLREILDDPLLVRTGAGMSATSFAKAIHPKVRVILNDAEQVFTSRQVFEPKTSDRVFRIMCSDYGEAVLLPAVIKRIRESAPGIIFDCLTPSDVSYKDMEQGKVDLAINRFNEMPSSFHQQTLWCDHFSCLVNPMNPIVKQFDLTSYLNAQHIWVSKTGLGVGFGVNPKKSGGLGWIDQALSRLGKKRKITIFTRHYQMPALLAMNNDLIATLPSKVAKMQVKRSELVIKEPPFQIPEFELKMAWSPMLHYDPSHIWLRQLIADVASDSNDDSDE